MNALVKKEILLLRPAFIMALLLASIPNWLLPLESNKAPNASTPYLFCLGVVFLALSSFGREFGLHTFPLMLVQPLERSRIWWGKIGYW